MKYAFVLSKENLELAKYEVINLLGVNKHKLIENILIIDLENIGSIKRLAYTKSVYELLFMSKDLIKDMGSFDWNKIYKKNFCIRINNFNKKIKYSEKKLAGYIWRGVKNPKVDLKNPKTKIELFLFKNKAYCCKLIYENKDKFEKRKAHLRPELHPTSLHPKLARALVNLSGVKGKASLIDLFCGAGGILIEAGLMGLKVVGNDLYKEMFNRAKVNLNYYKIKGRLLNKDAMSFKGKYDYVVSDPPYGLNASVWVKEKGKNRKLSMKQTDQKNRIKNLELFYLKVLKNLKKVFRKKAVIILPHYVSYRKLVKKAGLSIEKEFSQFIHGSSTRKILVLN